MSSNITFMLSAAFINDLDYLSLACQHVYIFQNVPSIRLGGAAA